MAKYFGGWGGKTIWGLGGNILPCHCQGNFVPPPQRNFAIHSKKICYPTPKILSAPSLPLPQPQQYVLGLVSTFMLDLSAFRHLFVFTQQIIYVQFYTSWYLALSQVEFKWNWKPLFLPYPEINKYCKRQLTIFTISTNGHEVFSSCKAQKSPVRFQFNPWLSCVRFIFFFM